MSLLNIGMIYMIALAMAGSLIISYSRARAETLGLDCSVGLMQRAERIVLLGVGSLIFGLSWDGLVLSGIIVIFAVLTNTTAIHRIIWGPPASRGCTSRRVNHGIPGTRALTKGGGPLYSFNRPLMIDQGDTTVEERPEIRPAEGRLGMLLPGMGAVATTTIAGVLLVRKGLATPIGSLTQMNTIRLGQRTENRTPLIKDFIGLAELDDIVFGGWDPIPDNTYESAVNAGVLSAKHLDPIKDELSAIAPMAAAFDTEYVTRLDGRNKKTGANKREIAEALREDIRNFKTKNGCDRLVMVWCGSTEIFLRAGPAHETVESFETAMEQNDPSIAPSMLYAYAALMEGVPYANGAPISRLTSRRSRTMPWSTAFPSAGRTSRPARRS